MGRSASKKCYRCSEPATTREHIPPKCIFPEQFRKNLITVPCCHSCNNGFSNDDEFLRYIASLAINAEETGQDGVRKLFSMSKGRVKKRFEGVRSVGVKIIPTPVGPVIGNQVGFSAKPIQECMIRITKGLLSVLYPEVDYSDFEYEIIPIDQFTSARAGEVLSRLGTGYTLTERGNGAFRAWHTVFEKGGYGGWFYSFYGALGFSVLHRFRTGQIRAHAGISFEEPSGESGAIISPQEI